MRKNKIIVIALSILLLTIISVNISQEFCYKLLHKSGESYKLNSNGNFEGRSRAYFKGVKIFDGYFNDGKLEGLVTKYFENGKMKSRTLYKNGIIDGFEYRYYPDGKISFKGLWKNGRMYGNQLYYSNKGKLTEYWARDFREMPNDFFYIFYNGSGDGRKILGSLVSENLMSQNGNAVEILKQGNDYKGIKDLYLTVARPPKFELSATVLVNDQRFFFGNLKSNTIKIVNAFTKPDKYRVLVFASLKENNKVVKNDTLDVILTKKL